MPCVRFFSVLLVFCVSSSLCAFVAPQNRDTSKRYIRGKVVMRPQINDATRLQNKNIAGRVLDVARDRLNGVPRILSGVDLGHFATSPAGGEASHHDVMFGYMAAGRKVLGVGESEVRLVPAATFVNHDTAFYKFDVYRDDLLVEDATLIFRFRHDRLVQVVNRTFAEAQPRQTDIQPLSDRQLQQLVDRELGNNKYVARGYAWRVVLEAARYELVKVRIFEQELGEQHRIQIDPITGRVFEVAPRLFYSGVTHGSVLANDESEEPPMVDGYARASIHPRWYKEELVIKPLSEITIGLSLLPDTPAPPEPLPTSVMTDIEGRYRIAALASPKIDNIAGAKVHIYNQTGPRVTVAGIKVENKWQTIVSGQENALAAHDKIVAQSMVFHHADYIFRLAANYITTPWFDKPLPSHTNLARSCNAHWDTLAGTINFYSGNNQCANTGLISDIIYHEWGHGLDAKTGGIKDGAYSEGFGDIMSMLITKSPIIGIGFGLDGRVVRDLDPDKIYPQDARGGVHAEGMVIGSTFWDMFNEFKKYHTEDEALNLLRKYAFQMIFTAEKYTDVYDALLVIDDDDADLTNGTPNFCLINEPFAQHGLATFQRSCLVISFVRNDVLELQGNGNRIIEPGELIEITPWVENVTDDVLQNLRGVASSASEFVQWGNNTAEWPQVAAGEKQPSSVPLTFTIAEDTTCGEKFSIALDFQLGKRKKHFSESFLVGRSAGQKALYQGVGLPTEIPDLETVEVAVMVDGEHWQADTLVYEAQLKFELKHTYHGDLNITLIAPNGEEIVIKKMKGRGRGVFTFDEDISELLRGRTGQGEWRLRVTDLRRLDRGVLNDFILTLTPKKFVCNPA